MILSFSFASVQYFPMRFPFFTSPTALDYNLIYPEIYLKPVKASGKSAFNTYFLYFFPSLSRHLFLLLPLLLLSLLLPPPRSS